MTALVRQAAASPRITTLVIALLSLAAVTVTVGGFGLRLTGGIALYFVIWWTALFVILPFGIRSQVEAGRVEAGTDPGAPAAPALREKALWTTILAGIVLIVAAALLPLSGL